MLRFCIHVSHAQVARLAEMLRIGAPIMFLSTKHTNNTLTAMNLNTITVVETVYSLLAREHKHLRRQPAAATVSRARAKPLRWRRNRNPFMALQDLGGNGEWNQGVVCLQCLRDDDVHKTRHHTLHTQTAILDVYVFAVLLHFEQTRLLA